MPIGHVAFDLDGTLIDTREQIVESLLACLAPEQRLESVRSKLYRNAHRIQISVPSEYGVSSLHSLLTSSHWTDGVCPSVFRRHRPDFGMTKRDRDFSVADYELAEPPGSVSLPEARLGEILRCKLPPRAAFPG